MLSQRSLLTFFYILVRERARKNGDEKCRAKYEWNVHVCSENNFPTAAGLASSAAGYACLVFALSKLFGVAGDISEIARRGSGSACRSIPGGYVRWHMGKEKDGTDSIASQIAPADHWKELRTLILVVSFTGGPQPSRSLDNGSRPFRWMANRRRRAARMG